MKKTLKNKKATKPTEKRITQGGMAVLPGQRFPDVVLQMPEVFYFDMNAYMNSVKSAKSIDYSNRVRLYDMYESALLDLHLSGVIAKRLRGVTKIPIEFQRNGEPDDTINAQLHSPWFKELRKDLVWSEFWGYTHEDKVIAFEQAIKRIVLGNIRRAIRIHNHKKAVARGEHLRLHTSAKTVEYSNTTVA